jgi:hypothetical protein
MRLSGAAIGTYRPQYRPLSAIRYLDANPLPTRYMLFSTLTLAKQVSMDTRLGEWQYAPSCVAQLVTADCNPDAS